MFLLSTTQTADIMNMMPFKLPECQIDHFLEAKNQWLVWLHTTPSQGRCPDCKQVSVYKHGYYQRAPRDVPLCDKRVRLFIRVRRFRCRNRHCPRATFAQRLSAWLPAFARRTRRLSHALHAVACMISAEAGARLLNRLKMPTSPDTLLRLVRRIKPQVPAKPQIIGIDDWALRKGTTYGTIIVDLVHHRVLDLLPDRTAATVKTWLARHRSIEVIARDRSSEYRKAVEEAAPQAVQVADRWHLLHNMTDLLKRLCFRYFEALKQLPLPVRLATVLAPPLRGPFPRTKAEQAASKAHRQKRIQRYRTIRRLYKRGHSLSEIARRLGLNWKTVSKYAHAEHFPDGGQRKLIKSILDPYLPYMVERFEAGCGNALQLWREICARGYPGTSKQVSSWMQQRKAWAAGDGPVFGVRLPSPRQLAWLLVKSPRRLEAQEWALLRYLRQHPVLLTVHGLARRFVVMIQQQQPAWLDPWLASSRASGIDEVVQFAAGIEREYAAVCAALLLPWSNGQTEGQITRLKLVKRQMYGRAKFDLLRLKVLHPG
jgi:transposase